MRNIFILMTAMLAAATLAIHASAQDNIDPPNAGKILLNSGQYLDIGKPRRVGDMDYVDVIDYRPSTHSITVTSHNIVNDQVMSSIKLVQGDDRSEKTLLSDTFDLHNLNPNVDHGSSVKFTQDQVKHLLEALKSNPDIGGPCLATRGWSRSGRYLLVEYLQIPSAQRPGKIVSIDMDAAQPVMRDIALDGDTDRDPYWSPDHTRAAFIMSPSHPEKSMAPDLIAIYDPSTGLFTKKVRPDTLVKWDEDNDEAIWVDNSLLTGENNGQKSSSTPNITGQHSVKNVKTLFQHQSPSFYSDCPIHPELTSIFNIKFLSDVTSPAANDPIPQIDVLQVERDQGPNKFSSATIAVGLRDQDITRESSQVTWASDGKQFAYTLEGQLYVVDVVDHKSTQQEKDSAVAAINEYHLDHGDPLPCNIVREIAVSRLKRIGLGMVQYMLDNDEKFPQAVHIDQTLNPYIKDNSVYSVGKYHWVYTPPKNLSLIKMESPAQTPIGHLDIPCAHLILYGDGHVKLK